MTLTWAVREFVCSVTSVEWSPEVMEYGVNGVLKVGGCGDICDFNRILFSLCYLWYDFRIVLNCLHKYFCKNLEFSFQNKKSYIQRNMKIGQPVVWA